MKKNIIGTGLLLATIGLMSCNSSKTKENQEVKTEQEMENSSASSSENTISIAEIDKIRGEIESLKIQPVEIASSELREKIKQKWSKIHFYVQDGIVVKVRTYPYTQITKRTEEFYANNNGLLLAIIEDSGEGHEGNDQNEMDKMYYYNNGKLIKELKKEKESEYTIKESDAEELLAEFNEYLEIYKNKK